MSFRARIALFGAGIVALTLLVFSQLVYGLAARGVGNTQDREILQRAQRADEALRTAPAEALRPSPVLAPADLADSTELFVEVLDQTGTPLSSTAVLDGRPPAIPNDVLLDATRRGQTLTTLGLAPTLSVRLAVRPWTRPDVGASGYLVVGQSTRQQQSTLDGIRGFLWLSGLLTFAAAALAIWLVAGRALRPLDLIARTAEEIRLTGDLSRRLPATGSWDELDRLAHAFNGMLDRLKAAQEQLAAALEAQRRFVADASHELRTPLTTIRSNAGLLLRRQDVAAADRAAALQDIAGESERMSRLVEDLLTLARADAGQHLTLDGASAPLDLAHLVREVARQAQQLHPDRHVHVDAEPAWVLGNGDALRQLLWIVLDNATHFTHSDGCIGLRLATRDGQAVLEVTDDGPGIPPADLERIFDRFVQADPARSRGGAGLGLSIARWIAHEHHGRIAARNNTPLPGATFSIELPLAAAHG